MPDDAKQQLARGLCRRNQVGVLARQRLGGADGDCVRHSCDEAIDVHPQVAARVSVAMRNQLRARYRNKDA